MSSTITTAQDAIDAVRGLVQKEALLASEAVKQELRYISTSLRNAIEAIEAIRIDGHDDADVMALYPLTGSVNVILQSMTPLGAASGRIEAYLRILDATKPSE